MEYGEELYAERLRRKAQEAALASGAVQWTEHLDMAARVKLGLAWEDITESLNRDAGAFLDDFIPARLVRSIGWSLRPDAMRTNSSGNTNERLLSLIEAEHEALVSLAEASGGFGNAYGRTDDVWDTRSLHELASEFQTRVNRIFPAHLVGLHLHHNSRLVPIDSHEMHDSVVVPTLYLLNSQPRFAGAERAYQNALRELRNQDAADAITDAATALQEVLTALGCEGGALGDLVASARRKGLLVGTDTPLTESIIRTVHWVAAKRNQGEAHRGDPDVGMSDAWMLVHVVGALAIRLGESTQ
ncbi:hypothetical protein [Mycobacterium kyogaense]|uniref:hypothetical protein n=1 Tax=Mycobacterium kyogaense TaxID=2212479 RepID=UPI000DAC6D92|nr:hypothetical protein [Mycobacterium kyogaense]